MNTKWLAIAVAVAVLLYGASLGKSAFAQEAPPGDQSAGLGEIVVTAQKRSENLQSVPLTVTAVDANALANANVSTAMDLNLVAPSVKLIPSNGTVTTFLRGLGNAIQSVGNEASVAVYFDGIYFNRLDEGIFRLNSIERIETLSGPQGTLFGRNASAGVIQIITRDPTPGEAFQMRATLGYANYQTVDSDVYVSGGWASDVASDLALAYHKQNDGWGTNFVTGDPTYRDQSLNVRSKTLAQLGDSTKATLTLMYGESNTEHGQSGQIPGHRQGFPDGSGTLPTIGFYDSQADYRPHAQAKSYAASLRLDHDLGPITLSNTAAYRSESDTDYSDNEASPQPNSYAFLASRSKQLSDEIQLVSRGDSWLQYTAGLFYLHQTAQYDPIGFGGTSFGPGVEFDFLSRSRSDSFAGYGQGTAEVAPGLKLTLGGRYSVDDIDGAGSSRVIAGGVVTNSAELSAANKFERFNFRTALSYQVIPDVLVYASVSSGYKAATYNLLPFTLPVALPERLVAYEVGFKSEFFDHRLRVNSSVFYYNITDAQVVTATGFTTNVGNAPKARARGLDFDATAELTQQFTLRGALNVLNNRYTKYDTAVFMQPSPARLGNLPSYAGNAAGNKMPFAPDATFSIEGQYRIPSAVGEWLASLNYFFNDGFFFEPQNRLRQPSYGLLGAQVALTPQGSRFKIKVYGNNLTDRRYYNYADAVAAPEGDIGYPAPPRTYGVSVDFKY